MVDLEETLLLHQPLGALDLVVTEEQGVVEHRDRILVDPQNQEDVEILPLFPQLWEVLKEMLEELEEMVLVNPVVVEVEPMLLVKLVLQHRVDMVEPVVSEIQIV